MLLGNILALIIYPNPITAFLAVLIGLITPAVFRQWFDMFGHGAEAQLVGTEEYFLAETERMLKSPMHQKVGLEKIRRRIKALRKPIAIALWFTRRRYEKIEDSEY